MSTKPGSPLFQRYKRCNWEIEGKPEDDEDGEASSCLVVGQSLTMDQ